MDKRTQSTRPHFAIRQRLNRHRHIFPLAMIAACLAGVVTPQAAVAQNRANSRDSLAVRAAFHDAIADAAKSVVRVRSDGRTLAFGTVVSEDGYVLTKSSELKGVLTCKLADGNEMDAELIGVHPEYDLAMLKIDAENLPVANWNLSGKETAGQWVVTPDIDGDAASVGVVSVARRRIRPISGLLGISMDEESNDGVRITEVTEGSGAEDAGLAIDDMILYVNRTRVSTSEELSNLLRTFSVGDIIRLRVRRGEDESTVEAEIGPRPRNFGRRGGRSRARRPDFQNSMGGPLSDRSSGFPLAIQHDSVLRPNECGGPLLDLDGRVIGINIARAGRVMSFALPADEVHSLIDDLKSGEYCPYIDFKADGAQDSDQDNDDG